MPPLARWYLKSALLYLLAGFDLQALLAAAPLAGLSPRLGALWPTYIHLIAVGWTTQLIFGVAFWMFPRFSKESPRGSHLLGWFTYLTLNAGLLLRVVGEPWRAWHPGPFAEITLTVSAVLQVLAGRGFVLNVWKRVRGPRRPPAAKGA